MEKGKRVMKTHPTPKIKLQLDLGPKREWWIHEGNRRKKRCNVGECPCDLGGEGFFNNTKYTNHFKSKCFSSKQGAIDKCSR